MRERGYYRLDVMIVSPDSFLKENCVCAPLYLRLRPPAEPILPFVTSLFENDSPYHRPCLLWEKKGKETI